MDCQATEDDREAAPSCCCHGSAEGRSMSLAERSVALQHLRPVDLDEEIHSSLTELSLLGRKASAEIRIRLLPMLDEVKRRYDLGETINKKKGYHEYLRSLGLTPSTVRSWKTRDHQRIVGD